MKIQQADRLKLLPPYLFAEIDRRKAELAAKGVDIISLGRLRNGMRTVSEWTSIRKMRLCP